MKKLFITLGIIIALAFEWKQWSQQPKLNDGLLKKLTINVQRKGKVRGHRKGTLLISQYERA